MFSRRHLTLLTDFGVRDGYVGILKGAIARVDPSLAVTDITHDIPPQDILSARFCLLNAYPYFPEETVHVAVVDPGVGTQRRGIAIQLDDGFLVGPDNGIFGGILCDRADDIVSVVELTASKYWRTPNPSRTFHARDIFAPVGAHIATGVRLDKLGTPIDPESLVRRSLPHAEREDGAIVAYVQYCDRFGNLITNVPNAWLAEKTWQAIAEDRTIPQGQTYSDAEDGSAVALLGSHGWLELGADRTSAAELLGLSVGDRVQVKYS